LETVRAANTGTVEKIRLNTAAKMGLAKRVYHRGDLLRVIRAKAI
jgi:hypothetical protein